MRGKDQVAGQSRSVRRHVHDAGGVAGGIRHDGYVVLLVDSHAGWSLLNANRRGRWGRCGGGNRKDIDDIGATCGNQGISGAGIDSYAQGREIGGDRSDSVSSEIHDRGSVASRIGGDRQPRLRIRGDALRIRSHGNLVGGAEASAGGEIDQCKPVARLSGRTRLRYEGDVMDDIDGYPWGRG